MHIQALKKCQRFKQQVNFQRWTERNFRSSDLWQRSNVHQQLRQEEWNFQDWCFLSTLRMFNCKWTGKTSSVYIGTKGQNDGKGFFDLYFIENFSARYVNVMFSYDQQNCSLREFTKKVSSIIFFFRIQRTKCKIN